MKSMVRIMVVMSVVAGIFVGCIFSYRAEHHRPAVGFIEGIEDPEFARDTTVGVLVVSSDKTKGEYVLSRGSDIFDVYLTSSAIDLQRYLHMGVRVWGQTIERDGVGWFMDVAKIEVVEK